MYTKGMLRSRLSGSPQRGAPGQRMERTNTDSTWVAGNLDIQVSVRPHRRVYLVGDLELLARVHNDGRNSGVVRVADAGEQVVHHLAGAEAHTITYAHVHNSTLLGVGDNTHFISVVSPAQLLIRTTL